MIGWQEPCHRYPATLLHMSRPATVARARAGPFRVRGTWPSPDPAALVGRDGAPRSRGASKGGSGPSQRCRRRSGPRPRGVGFGSGCTERRSRATTPGAGTGTSRGRP
eukprot:scaffold196_cov371-Prasinococcus_capsulatus_cf.AAC.6